MGKILKGKDKAMIAKCINIAIKVSLVVVLTTLPMSCSSQAPVAKPYPYSKQHKMQAAHHWDVLAADVVGRMDETVIPPGKAIYVSLRVDETTPFEKAFQNLLITQLVNAGYPVTEKDQGDMRMTYNVQLVQQDSDRFIRPGRGWIFVPVAAGVYIVKNIGETMQHWWPWALGGALAYEGVRGHIAVKPTDFEVIITTSLVDGNTYVMRHTDIYYINEPRWIPPLWEGNYARLGKTMEVVNQ